MVRVLNSVLTRYGIGDDKDGMLLSSDESKVIITSEPPLQKTAEFKGSALTFNPNTSPNKQTPSIQRIEDTLILNSQTMDLQHICYGPQECLHNISEIGHGSSLTSFSIPSQLRKSNPKTFVGCPNMSSTPKSDLPKQMPDMDPEILNLSKLESMKQGPSAEF